MQIIRASCPAFERRVVGRLGGHKINEVWRTTRRALTRLLNRTMSMRLRTVVEVQQRVGSEKRLNEQSIVALAKQFASERSWVVKDAQEPSARQSP